MIGVSGFAEKVRQIAARNPTYRTGGLGKDGTCDCIGLVMGAMYELGRKPYDMHSTNYFARYQIEDLGKIDADAPYVGQILFRAREGDERLNDRYKPGGRYDTGDTKDYYHVGVVTRTKPLEIIECTEYGKISGIVINSKLGGWHVGGKLKGVLYDGFEEEEKPMDIENPNRPALRTMIVSTQRSALNIREWPDGPVIGKAPKDAEVEILHDNGDGWPEIRYGSIVGYVSAEYLQPAASPVPGESEQEQEAQDGSDLCAYTMLIRSDGMSIKLEGSWRVAED